jgi:hypothetical protein
VARPRETVEVRVNATGHLQDGVERLLANRPSVLLGIPFDRPVVGYGGKTINTLRLWEAGTANAFDFGEFSSGHFVGAVHQRIMAANLTHVLYPDDSTEAGRGLWFAQEYFLVACSLADIMGRFRLRGNDWQALPEKVAIQLNDTHLAMAVAELMAGHRVQERDVEESRLTILCGGETTMTGRSASLTRRPEWATLQEHYQKIKDGHLHQLFADDPKRGERLAAEAVGLYFDYSKHCITDETIRLLVQLVEACGLRERIEAMFRGGKINLTEDRAVLHVALRAPKGHSIVVDGEDVVPPFCAMPREVAISPAPPLRRAGRRHSTSSTARILPNTSRRSTPISARSWGAITRRAMRA